MKVWSKALNVDLRIIVEAGNDSHNGIACYPNMYIEVGCIVVIDLKRGEYAYFKEGG